MSVFVTFMAVLTVLGLSGAITGRSDYTKSTAVLSLIVVSGWLAVMLNFFARALLWISTL